MPFFFTCFFLLYWSHGPYVKSKWEDILVKRSYWPEQSPLTCEPKYRIGQSDGITCRLRFLLDFTSQVVQKKKQKALGHICHTACCAEHGLTSVCAAVYSGVTPDQSVRSYTRPEWVLLLPVFTERRWQLTWQNNALGYRDSPHFLVESRKDRRFWRGGQEKRVKRGWS